MILKIFEHDCNRNGIFSKTFFEIVSPISVFLLSFFSIFFHKVYFSHILETFLMFGSLIVFLRVSFTKTFATSRKLHKHVNSNHSSVSHEPCLSLNTLAIQ